MTIKRKKGVTIKEIGVDHHKLRRPKSQSLSKTRDQHSGTDNTSLLVQHASLGCNFTEILFDLDKKNKISVTGKAISRITEKIDHT